LIHNGKLFYFSDQFGTEILTVNFSSVKSKTNLEFTDLLDTIFYSLIILWVNYGFSKFTDFAVSSLKSKESIEIPDKKI